MTLFIDQSGEPSSVFGDLYSISRQDGGLGDTDVVGDPTVVQVTYDETAGQPATADRLNTLVNTDFGTPIVMTALAGGIDPYSGLDVTGNGFTYIDSSSGSNVIRVVYDVSQCNGAGIFMYDIDGNQIASPNPVILYHELSHAYRAATGTTQPNDEPPAETDENVMRSELGLCLRDVNNHDGGCGPGDSCGGSSNGNGNGCFIVSASAGSPEAAEVVRLKQLRDRVVRATVLGARLLDAIYREYYRFSPGIAADLRDRVEMRARVLALVVRPLIAWYALAEALALASDDPDAIAAAGADVLASCARDADAREMAETLDGILRGEMPPSTAPEPLRYLYERGGAAAGLPFARWAIVEPLAGMWTAAACDGDVVAIARDWLAAAPLEKLTPPDDNVLDAELRLIAHGALKSRAHRERVGRRLVREWPQKRDVLLRHGFSNEAGVK